jgi:uncharacterized protein (DUF58 family)
MDLFSYKILSKAYLVIILLIATLTAPFPYSIVALVLLATQSYTIYKPPHERSSLVLTTCTLVIMPLTFVSLIGMFSAFLIIPALFLLDQNLKNCASNQFINNNIKEGRKGTIIFQSLGSAILIVFVSSIILLNLTLTITTSILLGYIGAVLMYVLRSVPKKAIESTHKISRIIVGDTDQSAMTLKTKSKLPLYTKLQATVAWVEIEPTTYLLQPSENINATLLITPPLAAPSKLEVKVSMIDPWGLIQLNQNIEPVEVHIIPRAKYAQWLARKFLDQTASGASPIDIPPIKNPRSAKRGVEFYGIRRYEAGDLLRDIDWKHSTKLQELIVREYVGAHGQPTIIVVNLDAQNAEDADKLAHNLVMTALTLANETLPSALAAYNRNGVIATTKSANPRDTLVTALKLTRQITIVEHPKKVLQPAEVLEVKRSLRKLEQSNLPSSYGFSRFLRFQTHVTDEAARAHPAALAIEKAVQNTFAPAIITIVASTDNDKEALNITLNRLKQKGYNAFELEGQ